MPHPLQDLNAKRKYVFSFGDEDLFLRVVTTGDEVARHPEAIKLYKYITFEAHKNFQTEGKKLKNPPAIEPTPEDVAKRLVAVPQQFSQHDNFTYFIVENRQGDPVCVLSMSINGPTYRRDLKVPDDVKAFAYFHGIITQNTHAGAGIFASAFDEIISIISQRFERPVEIAIPVGSVELLGDVKEHAGHGALYTNLLKKLCGDDRVSLQKRVRHGWDFGNEKAASDRMSVRDYNEVEISGLMTELRDRTQLASGDGIGLYVIGSMNKEHESFVAEKERRLRGRVSLSRNEALSQEWAVDAPASAAEAVSGGRLAGVVAGRY